MNQTVRTLTAGTAFAAIAAVGMLISSPRGQAANDNDNNGAQDEKLMIQLGKSAAPVQLNLAAKDSDMVYLGSFLVNVAGDCNGCHTADPSTEFVPTGNPSLRTPPNGPFLGTKIVNAATYLGGGSVFGPLPGPDAAHPVPIISRNLTPDYTGMAEGGHTLYEFMQIMRTGVDMDHAHPNCPTNTPVCLPPPFNGDLLQVMPWPNFQNMTDRQLTAIYAYLSAIPCLEGGPGEPAVRCTKPAKTKN